MNVNRLQRNSVRDYANQFVALLNQLGIVMTSVPRLVVLKLDYVQISDENIVKKSMNKMFSTPRGKLSHWIRRLKSHKNWI